MRKSNWGIIFMKCSIKPGLTITNNQVIYSPNITAQYLAGFHIATRRIGAAHQNYILEILVQALFI